MIVNLDTYHFRKLPPIPGPFLNIQLPHLHYFRGFRSPLRQPLGFWGVRGGGRARTDRSPPGLVPPICLIPRRGFLAPSVGKRPRGMWVAMARRVFWTRGRKLFQKLGGRGGAPARGGVAGRGGAGWWGPRFGGQRGGLGGGGGARVRGRVAGGGPGGPRAGFLAGGCAGPRGPGGHGGGRVGKPGGEPPGKNERGGRTGAPPTGMGGRESG